MIWALLERKARHKAEMEAGAARSDATLARNDADRWSKVNEILRIDKARAHETIDELQTLLNSARAKLVACRDPDTVHAWLDEKLKGREL
jgi:hypothetical protein